MKRLLTLLFTAVIACSLAMPVFANGAGPQDTKDTSAKKTKAAEAKTKKTKVVATKKAKAPTTTAAAPKQ